MTTHVTTLTLLLAYITVISAQTCQQPRMSDVQVVADFDLDRFLGLWYEVSWIPENFFPPEYNYADFISYFEKVNDTYINVYWAGRETAGDADCLMGDNYFIPLATPGKFTYVRIINVTTGETLDSEYWVILTDYDNYALVYGCRERGANGVCLDGKLDSWVWSRKTTMSNEHQELVKNKTLELCVNQTFYYPTDHVKLCPYPVNDAPSHLTPLLCQILAIVWISWSILIEWH